MKALGRTLGGIKVDTIDGISRLTGLIINDPNEPQILTTMTVSPVM